MSKYVFYASISCFARLIMILKRPKERDTILIGDLALLNIVIEQDRGFELGGEAIQRNVRAANISANFTVFTGEDRENSSNFLFLW